MAVSLKTAESLFRSTDNGGTNKGEFPGCRQVIFKDRIHFNSHYPGSAVLPNTCNVSVLGPTLPGWRVLSQCRRLLASVGAACHSDSGNRPSPILLNCGVPKEVAANALRLSVGRGTTRKDVHDVLEDLKETVLLLEKNQLKDLK